MSKNVVVIGAGGHAKVIVDIIEKSGDKVIGFLDDDNSKKEVYGYKVIGKINECHKFVSANTYFIIAIGNNYLRKKINNEQKLQLYTAIHPMAVIARGVEIGAGTTIMANVCINAGTKIGKNCIINTGAIIEHDNTINDYVHISPNATLAGTVTVGELTHIGAGAIVINNKNITSEAIIGAGAVVVKDIIKKGTYIGIPAKLKNERN